MLHEILGNLSENIFSKITIAALAGTTLATSGVAGYKIVKSLENSPVHAAPIEVQTDPVGSATISPQPSSIISKKDPALVSTKKPSATPSPSGASNSQIANNTFPLASVSPATANQTPTAGTSATKCIVTIFGVQYDLTNFHHPVPIQIDCGQDMSAKFQGAHGSDIARLAPYKLNSTSGTSSGTSGSTGATGYSDPSRSSSETEYEDEEDKELEHSYENQKNEKAKESNENITEDD